jgi:hypothetical protein
LGVSLGADEKLSGKIQNGAPGDSSDSASPGDQSGAQGEAEAKGDNGSPRVPNPGVPDWMWWPSPNGPDDPGWMPKPGDPAGPCVDGKKPFVPTVQPFKFRWPAQLSKNFVMPRSYPSAPPRSYGWFTPMF